MTDNRPSEIENIFQMLNCWNTRFNPKGIPCREAAHKHTDQDFIDAANLLAREVRALEKELADAQELIEINKTAALDATTRAEKAEAENAELRERVKRAELPTPCHTKDCAHMLALADTVKALQKKLGFRP